MTFAERDIDDRLAHLRDLFELPENQVYLDGNSLGALPKGVAERIEHVVRGQWGNDLISSWNHHDWIGLPQRVGDRIAPLVGAEPGQVICADTISTNLFKLLSAALSLQTDRRVILSQQDNFPTDLYMAEGLQALLGPDRCEYRAVSAPILLDSLSEDVAVLMLTQVNFRDGSLHDMAEMTREAHRHGALVLWDLAHSAGVVPVELDAWEVDMAVGCGYKFLNGGPGAPAFLYLARRHQENASQPLCGWMGHRRPFDFEADYQPAPGVQRFLAGTPGILGMAALDAALDAYEGVSIHQLRRKSTDLTACFIDALDRADLPEMRLLTPRSAAKRGSQVSLAHPDGFAVAQALIDRGIIVDFRAPNIVRFGFSPMYNRFADVRIAIEALADITKQEHFRDPRYELKQTVT
ncbi:MAG: kynureninase [Gammaproteobacteria bacterium]|nr:kynureninase [Gammaproteobacteria bacterium]